MNKESFFGQCFLHMVKHGVSPGDYQKEEEKPNEQKEPVFFLLTWQYPGMRPFYYRARAKLYGTSRR